MSDCIRTNCRTCGLGTPCKFNYYKTVNVFVSNYIDTNTLVVQKCLRSKRHSVFDYCCRMCCSGTPCSTAVHC